MAIPCAGTDMDALCANSPPLVLTEHGGILVVRDDKMPGGTKARVLPLLLSGPAREYVYASPVYGYAQIALAVTARAMGKRATIFCAQRLHQHARTREALRYGARVVEVPAGYLSVVQARARAYCAISGAALLPFGLDTPCFIAGLAAVARTLPVVPYEVWAVAGSGVLVRALQQAWPAAAVHAVQIGSLPRIGHAMLYQAPEQFAQDARVSPPFPSCSNYDAKAWRFVQRYASPGALFWNCAA